MNRLPTTPQPTIERVYEADDGATAFLTYEFGDLQLQGVTYPTGRTAAKSLLATTHAHASVGAMGFPREDVRDAWVSVRVSLNEEGHSSEVAAYLSVEDAKRLQAKLGEAIAEAEANR